MKPLKFVEAIAWAKAQSVVLPDVFYGERMAQARVSARTISGLAGVDQIQSVFDKLDKVLDSGGTFDDFKKSVKAGAVNIGLPKHRLELIYRNNIQSAYMGGRWQQVEQNKDNRPYLQYSAINDGRTRPSHRKMHGFIARVDDKVWGTWLPLNGHRCRCTVLSLSEKQAKAIGISEPTKGKPDTGWDYNAGMTPSKGLKQAAKHKKGVVDDRLSSAVEHAVNPNYVPVSSAIEAVGYKRVTKHVMHVIDGVHSDGVLPLIPMKRSSSTEYNGAFLSRAKTGSRDEEASAIKLSKHAKHKEFTLAHEIGHFIDLEGIGKKGEFASESGSMSKVIESLRGSKLARSLKTHLEKKEISADHANYIEYLLDETELWARAYAQWVTVKSRDAIMLKQLKAEQYNYNIYPKQWLDDDFEPIKLAIDDLIRELKWAY